MLSFSIGYLLGDKVLYEVSPVSTSQIELERAWMYDKAETFDLRVNRWTNTYKFLSISSGQLPRLGIICCLVLFKTLQIDLCSVRCGLSCVFLD